ncbi:hypothetical protein [Sphingomonas bacterium]|uniref:hypothetical protein n=1 Tax=Sphingomonas bacterium TaxID=1895847 RepID=UPI001577405F|nr:hypothetical protein [Sphingomonas bacterium]
MSKTLLAAVILCAGWTASADAKAFKIGEDVAWISIPDTWEPETFDNGVEGTSPDRETYVAAEIVDGDTLADASKDEEKFFKKMKIKIKEDTFKQKKIQMSGLDADDLQWEATDADGPTHVSVTLVKIAEKKLLMMTYWGSEAGEKTNGAELNAISESIKPIR